MDFMHPGSYRGGIVRNLIMVCRPNGQELERGNEIMTVCDTIMKHLKDAGYDTITANALARDKVVELKSSPRGRYQFIAGSVVMVVDKA